MAEEKKKNTWGGRRHLVAVCELNGEYILKRFVSRGHDGCLVSVNPDCLEIKMTESDTFGIWGTVTYIIYKLRV